MNLDWDNLRLGDDILDDPNFKVLVKTALRTEWPPPKGLILNPEGWKRNYDIWHRHLVPLEDFMIPIEEAIETKGLPYYSPAEDPNNVSEESRPYVLIDNLDREELIRKAKDKYDMRWYILLHCCYFNAATIWFAVSNLYPKLKWRAIEDSEGGCGHVVITTATKEQFYQYLNGNLADLKDENFYIADPVITTRKNFAGLMAGKELKGYNDLYTYFDKVYKEFFTG